MLATQVPALNWSRLESLLVYADYLEDTQGRADLPGLYRAVGQAALLCPKRRLLPHARTLLTDPYRPCVAVNSQTSYLTDGRLLWRPTPKDRASWQAIQAGLDLNDYWLDSRSGERYVDSVMPSAYGPPITPTGEVRPHPHFHALTVCRAGALTIGVAVTYLAFLLYRWPALAIHAGDDQHKPVTVLDTHEGSRVALYAPLPT